MSIPPDCDYCCRTCGLNTCRDEAPSPCEDHRHCADCAPCDDCQDDAADERADQERREIA